jgi:EAL and modified HD-GYP domain-containing signal transduction protein
MSGFNDRPDELLRMSMMRARMCEQIAAKSGYDDTDSFFTVGLFSVLDALLGVPMRNIVDELPFSIEMKSALLEEVGRMGDVLKCVLVCEQSVFEQSDDLVLNRMQLRDIYLDAIAWSNENSRQLLK